MPIRYRVVQNKIKDTANYNQWYAKAVTLGSVSTHDLCEEIAHSCAMTEADVTACLIELARYINQHLIDSSSVKLDGLGTFYPTIRCLGTDKKEDVDSSRFRSVGVRFLPEKYKVGTISASKGKNKAVWQARLIKGYTTKMADVATSSSASSSTQTGA